MKHSVGYLLVDHSNSPGLPADVARKFGYDPKLCKEGKKFEADTLKCCECAVTVVKSPMRDLIKMPRHKCSCDKYLCDLCAFRGSQPGHVHVPYAKRIQMVYDARESNKPTLILP